MTTVLFCLDLDLTCVTMDTAGVAYRYAVGRLRVFATPGATMENLEDYTDPGSA